MNTRARTLTAVLAAACLAPLPARAQDAAQSAPVAPAPPAVTAPRVKTDPGAAYPAEALRDRVTVTVTVPLVLEIDAAGAVTKATVATPQGHGFDEAAVEAASRLVFEPATRGGVAVRSRITYTYVFTPPPPRLAGRVGRNADDAPIAGAAVTIRSVDGAVHVVATAADGTWAAPELPPGAVHVEVTAPGFEPRAIDDALATGEETRIVMRLGAAPAANAPDAGAGDTEDITVKGERPPREVTKRTLEREEIAHIPGTNGDALRSLTNLPGVARPPPFRGILVVRGSAPQDTHIFVDGTPIPIVYHFGGLSSVVPTEVLNKIDFYPGNYSAQYGRGMGGIVDVGIRAPSKDAYHGLGQLDLIDARVLAEGPIAGGWSFLVAGRRSWFDLWLGPVLRRAQAGVTVAPRYYDYQAILQKDFDSHSSFRLMFFGSDDAVSILRMTPSQQDPTFGGNIDTSIHFWRIQGRYQNKVSSSTELRVTAAVGQDVQETGFGTNYVRSTTTPITGRAELSQKVATGVIANTGFDVQVIPYEAARRGPPPRRAGVPSGGPGEVPLESSQSGTLSLPGAYSEWEITPWRGTRFVPAVRVDWDSATKGWDVAPRFNARQDLTSGFPRTTLKGGLGLYYQPPEPIETDPVFGNPNLSSNRSVHYDVGLEQEVTRQIDVSTDVWYKALDRLVVPGAGNSGDGFAYGVEWLVRYKPDARFFGWLAYTLSRSERRDLPTDVYRLFRYDQTHILTVLGSYKLGRGWQLGARFRLVSGNLYTPATYGAYDATVGSSLSVSNYPPFGARLPLFEQLDIRIDKTWTFSKWKLTAYLDVQNVYNRGNPEGVVYNYDHTQSAYINGLPLLPAIGLRGEF